MQELPMGLCNSPNIFQEKMSELFDGLEFVRTYIDDLLCLTKDSFEDQLEKLEQVLHRLLEAGLKVNGNKSFFTKTELEYLGYWITWDGIKPLPEKVKAILAINAPQNCGELRSFIGIINYFRDMWVRRSHVLAPLASLTTNKAKWSWGPQQEVAFQMAKKIIAREVMLAYPDFGKPFEIHKDASHYQLGVVISQGGKPINFYSCKLNPAQTRYMTTERELLSIVETLRSAKTSF
jgi:RNase H-like domain found in reverse transcriptase/Reverse transcriptase (RNA-dependent DNA polymerase)